jgi:hypothetical protein
MTTQQETTWRATYRIKNRERLNEASRVNYHKTKAERAITMAVYRQSKGTRLRKITLQKNGLTELPDFYKCSRPVFRCFSQAVSV